MYSSASFGWADPVENGYPEGFNGRLRRERLNVEWFASLTKTRRPWQVTNALQRGETTQCVG
jgi:hypothetical protein